MNKLKVEVTEQDIADGEPESPWQCPVAIATKRATKSMGGFDVSVCSHSVWAGMRRYEIPAEVQEFIARFDNNQSVKPISFELEVK